MKKSIYILCTLMISLALFACAQATSTVTPTHLPTKILSPYRTTTTILSSPTQSKDIPLSRTPAPTVTPFAHTIEKGETMLGIAIRYGIELEDLQAANPDVNPNILSVGSQLNIPLGVDVQSSAITPTPIPISLGMPECYQTSDGGTWCFIPVENTFSYDLENITARVGLFSKSDENFVETTAFSPLNRIIAGGRVPLMVFFPAPNPVMYEARAELLTAVAISDNTDRYLDGKVEIKEVNFSADGVATTITGQVSFPDSLSYPGLLWLLAVAYDEDGAIVGVRKWEAVFPKDDPLAIGASTPVSKINGAPTSILPINFDIEVYSLGPKIKQVEVILEARP